MLKGHVFKEQIFGNQIFALFINTFLNGKNGISNNYKNGMKVTYSGSTLTVQSGAICIQGRFLEEDTSTDIFAGTESAFCKLVLEIDLSKQNTVSEFNQASYKIVKSISSYPNVTQTDIVNNNTGIYQYELARFKTSTNGIIDFQDMRTFLDFDSIYKEIEQHIRNIDDGSLFIPKANYAILTGTITMPEANSELLGSSTDINYPTGFTKNNCVIISLMSHNSSHTDWWSTRAHYDSTGYIQGSQDLKAALKPEGITVWSRKVDTIQPRNDVAFKIVLMKIEDNSYKLGDVNGDGFINNIDVQKINDYIQGNTTLTSEQYKAADVNKDGYVDTGDTYKLQRFISGQISSLD